MRRERNRGPFLGGPKPQGPEDCPVSPGGTEPAERILILLPKGLLSALYAEPAIRALGSGGARRKEIAVCHENADLYAGHPAVHGVAYSEAGGLAASFDKVITLRGALGKEGAMDWVFEVARQLGVTLEQQAPQIALNSFDFVRTQRFGISKLARPRIAIAMAAEASSGWPAASRRDLCRLLRSRMSAGLVYVGGCHGEIEESAKDLRGKLMAREIAAVLKQCDLLISEEEEMVSLAAAVQTPVLYICRKSWDQWPAAEGARVISIYPEKPEEVLEAMGRLNPAFTARSIVSEDNNIEST